VRPQQFPLRITTHGYLVQWSIEEPNQPEGEANIRFDIYDLTLGAGQFLLGHTTRLPQDTALTILFAATNRIFEILLENEAAKERLELLSWMSPETFDYPMPYVSI